MCIQLPSYIDNSGAVSQSVRETRAALGLELGPTLLVLDNDFCLSFYFVLKVLVCFSLTQLVSAHTVPTLNVFVI